jgi:hypothetical protein
MNSTIAEKEQWWVDFEGMMLGWGKKAQAVKIYKESKGMLLSSAGTAERKSADH